MYSWLCSAAAAATNSTNGTTSDGSAVTCIEQELGLARIFLAGNVCAIGATLPIGMLMDWQGPKATAVASFLLMFLGALTFALSSEALDMYPWAFGLMGFAAPGCIMSTFHTTSLFPVHKGTVLAVVNAAYDSSSVMCLLFLGIYIMVPNVQLYHLFIFYGCCVLLPLLVVYVWIMPRHRIVDVVAEEKKEKKDKKKKKEKEKEKKEEQGKKHSPQMTAAEPSVSKEVCSIKWLLFSMFFSVNLLRFSYYLGSVGPAMVQADPEQANEYLSILGGILPCGFVVSPALGWAIDSSKQSTSVLMVFLLGLVHSIAMCIPSLPLQILTFVLFTLFRSLFFTVGTTFAVRNFSPSLVGKVFGLTTLAAAVLSSTQYLLVEIALALDSFLVPHLVVLASSVLSLPLYFWLLSQESLGEKVVTM